MARVRIKRRTDIFYNITVVLLIAGIVFLSYRLVSNIFLYRQDIGKHETPVYRHVDNNSKDFFSEIWTRISRIDLTDPAVILSSQMPYLAAAQANEYNNDGTPAFASKEDAAAKEDNNAKENSRGLISRLDSDDQDIEQNISDQGYHEDYRESDGDGREVSDEIKIEISTISDTMPPVDLSGEGPQILIYHTHTLEAYRQDPNNKYEAIAAFRSSDLNHTVVGVGEVLAENLRKRGIPVVHDKTNHEQYSWKNGLYPRSLETIKRNMEKYDSLKIFLDIHRNYNESLKDPDKEVVIINGERVAKFFVLIGTGEGVSGGFAEKPNWRENYKFALKITNKANEKYPGLAGDIRVQSGRYNQHVSTKAILIEIGNHLTTLEEAKRTAVYLAEIISEVIEK